MNTSTDVVEAHCNMALRSQVFDALRRYEVSDDCFAAIASITHAALTKPDDEGLTLLREALEPVLHWYQSDEHKERPLIEIVRDVVADLQEDRAWRLNPPKHRFWYAGDPDCPSELKAGNGELHTLRCKICGGESPRDEFCRTALQPTNREEEIRADERERCAKIADGWMQNSALTGDCATEDAQRTGRAIAQAIRNGETK